MVSYKLDTVRRMCEVQGQTPEGTSSAGLAVGSQLRHPRGGVRA